MRIDNRQLALLTAAFLGAALIGCQRDESDPRAGSEGIRPPLAAAPGTREAPANTERPIGAASEREKSWQPAISPEQKMKDPGDTTPAPNQR